ncbi:sulfotransferase family protein [Paucibacter sp. DJ2R-2]|uniref:sulfotransferase family protein n=1 Tax=Paucibacter sp. DJ2R-2 TaxID=2893558 RepID=UPI0021E43F02|nr:sulfotransferase [Paucibacter sp. DJ2R-2]MCV2423110.1 sulfotransferase [Paucibacter sp. DJ4R-1]MCV2441005.1 sulfotransferase [Paucibacter sp. DJ2R-2]
MNGSSGKLTISPALLHWLREDPSWQTLPLTTRAKLSWQAHWGGVNHRLSRHLEVVDASGQVPLPDPIFIVGPWRSGTTVMHELLTAASAYPTPRTWQCMDPCAFRLTGMSGKKNAALSRPMDGLPIHRDSPQEDEFALLGMGHDSAYRAFWMPHRFPALAHTLDPAYWLSNYAWMADWEDFLRATAANGNRAGLPLILKSPNHSFRLPALLRHFPGARVIWMARKPQDVFHSNRKMWSQMCASYGLSQMAMGDLDHFLAAAFDQAAQALDWCSETLPAQQWAVVDSQQLLDSPAETITALWARLRFTTAIQTPALDQAIARTREGRVDRYAGHLPAAAQAAVARLESAQRAIMDQFQLKA